MTKVLDKYADGRYIRAMHKSEAFRQATIATLARGVRKGRKYTDLVYKLHGVTREEVERYAARIVSSDYIRQH